MITLREIWCQGVDILRQAGVETPALDAEILLRHLTGQSREEFYRDLTAPWPLVLTSNWKEIINRRAHGTPVAYLTGEKEFFGLSLKVAPAVLVPRPETEILVERALQLVAEQQILAKCQVLDIGTGSGAIAIALAVNLPEAFITATDVSDAALEIAGENAIRHKVKQRVRFCSADLWPEPKSDWEYAWGQQGFHLIVSNLPYIPSGDIQKLAPEVRQEPELALDGGLDGLDIYRRLVSGLKEHLLPNGWVLLEVGSDQADTVSRMLASVGLSVLPPLLDLAGHKRVVQAVYR